MAHNLNNILGLVVPRFVEYILVDSRGSFFLLLLLLLLGNSLYTECEET